MKNVFKVIYGFYGKIFIRLDPNLFGLVKNFMTSNIIFVFMMTEIKLYHYWVFNFKSKVDGH